MQKALNKIESSLNPNYAAIAKKYNLNRFMLSRRAKSKITFKVEF